MTRKPQKNQEVIYQFINEFSIDMLQVSKSGIQA
jgi:hypothetical protein